MVLISSVLYILKGSRNFLATSVMAETLYAIQIKEFQDIGNEKMDFNDLVLHDATILKVIEDTENDTLDWVLDYPIDWENEVYQKRILRFYDLVSYEVSQFPFQGAPSILDYEILEESKDQFGNVHKMVKIITNAGERKIIYRTIELLDLDSI